MPQQRPHAPNVAIVGSGPIGLEAAIHGVNAGFAVRLYEKGRLGEHLRQWGHVRMFTPWSMNRSAAGEAMLRSEGHSLPDGQLFPTADEYVERYLVPLSRCASLADRIHEQTQVLQVGRTDRLKSDLKHRNGAFRLLLRGPGGEALETADAVLDCSGVYSNPNRLGNGGIPAIGESKHGERIDYHLLPPAELKEKYRGATVLLVGAGYSAATALPALLELSDTRVIWIDRRERKQPFREIPGDPLVQRVQLGQIANRLAAGDDPRVDYRPGRQVERIESGADGLEITLSTRSRPETLQVDRVLALVGYHPDASIYRQLQVHECWATCGPMRLAASLLEEGSEDCLTQVARGAETLRNPEPDFFILGAKSYGTQSHFLIRLGLEQIREAYSLLGAAAASPVQAESQENRRVI